jgi:hypothetical protein
MYCYVDLLELESLSLRRQPILFFRSHRKNFLSAIVNLNPIAHRLLSGKEGIERVKSQKVYPTQSMLDLMIFRLRLVFEWDIAVQSVEVTLCQVNTYVWIVERRSDATGL